MMALRPLGYLLLVVALIANGLVADGMAMAAATATSMTAVTPADASAKSEHGGCHESATATAAVDDPVIAARFAILTPERLQSALPQQP